MLIIMSSANFKRPIVILGPLNDIAMEKLAKEMPDDYEVAGWYTYLIHGLKSITNHECTIFALYSFFLLIFLCNMFLLLGFFRDGSP